MMLDILTTFLRKTTSIRSRLYLIVFLMGVLFYFASILQFKIHIDDVKQEKLSNIKYIVSALVSKTAEQALSRGNKGLLDDVIKELLETTKIVHIAVYDIDNSIFVEAGDTMYSRSLEVFEANIASTNIKPDFSDIDSDTQSIIETPKMLGIIVYQIDVDSLESLVWKNTKSLLIFLIVAMVVCFPIVYLLSRSILRPLTSTLEIVGKFERGSFEDHVKIEKSINDEFSLLERALIRSGNSIASKSKEVERINNNLVQKTKQLEKQVQLAIEARKSADEANAKKDIFVSNITHEMKAPLTGIVSGLEFVEAHANEIHNLIESTSHTGYSSRNELRECIYQLIESIDVAKLGSDQISVMITDLVASIQDVYNDIFLNEADFELNNSVQQIVNRSLEKSKEKGITFNYSSNIEENIWIRSDWIRIAQVINELTSNAIRFTNEGNVDLQISIDKKPDSVLLHVSIVDTGLGISLDQQKDIFELFQIAENPSYKRASGIGTGLSIAQKITEQLRGKIYLKYSSVGEGSAFAFECHLSKVDGKNLSWMAEQCKKNKSIRKNINLLYVEDSRTNQIIFKEYCKRYGVNLILANNGKEGFERYLNGSFDGLVIDCYMPIENGYDLVLKIRNNEVKKTQKSLIFALTADDSSKNRKKCSDVGFDVFVSKPYNSKAYKDILRKITDAQI